MDKLAVFILGRPGSGKDTQAELLAEKLDLMRISTSDVLKEKLYSPKAESDPKLIKEREIFESGKLCTPSFVLGVIKEYIQNLVAQNFNDKNGIIFSGSPRTPYESENLIPFLVNLFGKENLLPVYLDISEEVGIERIIERNKINPRPLDEGEEKLKLRTKEFIERTWPAIQEFEKRGIPLIKVDGERPIEKVHKEIMDHLK
ncbi:MAG: nucleoside monophosphate kinase [Candidatus Spechtbacterales bacterium]|nr:nucleoside monophosphate kinase [Candidatus Spechtbacterales bacterium]